MIKKTKRSWWHPRSGKTVPVSRIMVQVKHQNKGSALAAAPGAAPRKLQEEEAPSWSITGIDIIQSSDVSWLRRSVWLFILVACVINMVYQVSVALLRYSREEVLTSWTTAEDRQQTFPAVTVCNLNMWKRTFVDQYLQPYGNLSISEWDDDHVELIRWGEDDYGSVLGNASYQPQDTILDCIYNGEVCTEETVIMKNVQVPEGYQCTTVQPLTRAVMSWVSPQLRLVLQDSEPYDERRHEGWAVIAHPAQIPFSVWAAYTGWYSGTFLLPLEEGSLTVAQSSRSRLERGSAHRGSKACRDAISQVEHIHCTTLCFWRLALAEVERPCRLPQMPAELWTTPGLTDLEDCSTPDQVHQLSEYQEHSEQEAGALSKHCNCSLPCSTQSYPARSKSRHKMVHPDVDLSNETQILTEPVKAARMDVLLWSERSSMVESWKMTGNELLSEIGGHLGLMLGGSVLTLMELLDRLIVSCSKMRHRRKKK